MRSYELVLFATFVAIVMVSSPAVVAGYATPIQSYSATSVCADNSLSVDYFTVGLYSESTCQTAAQNILTSNTIEYTSSGNVRTLSTSSISLSELYLKIDKTNHVWHNDSSTFTVTAESTVKFDNTIVQSAVVSLLFDDTELIVANSTTSSGSTELTEGIHSLSFSITDASVEMASEPSGIVLILSITVEDNNLGVTTSNSSRTLTAVSSAVIVDPTTASNSIEEANQYNPDFNSENPAYEFKPAEEQHNSQGHAYYTVEVSSTSNTGIAYQGNVDVELSIPSGVKFSIHCYGPGNGTGSTNKLQALISVDGSPYKTCTFFYKGSSFNGYIFNNNSSGIFSPVMYTQSSNPTQVRDKLNDSDSWISGNTVNVRLQDDGSNNIPDNLHLEICLWPTE